MLKRVDIFVYYFIIFFIIPNKVISNSLKEVSPIMFGILEAKDGLESYDVLLKTHTFAFSLGLPVIYKGIKEISIEIPSDAKSIPLSSYTDFSGTKISVLNQRKDYFLFSLSNEMKSIDVSSRSIDTGVFKHGVLGTGTYLLSVEDQNAWIPERVGYGVAFNRKDILFVKDGYSENFPISSYNNKQSNPKCKYVKVNTSRKTIKNLNFIRDSLSIYKTNLFKVSGQYNVTIENISIKTPDNDSLYGDLCIQINDSYKVKLNKIDISGTYSLPKKYGYGINMNNVSDFETYNLNANANWGIFGTNNVSNVTIRNSSLNRFDIHCYGKNIRCFNCVFKELYNQYSSIFGYIKYNRCIFDNCTPVLLEPSFNAYTAFNLLIENCEFVVSKDKNYVVYARKMVKDNNDRMELKEIYWPNITINNLRIINNDNVKELFLYYNDKSYYQKPLMGSLSIKLKGIKYSSRNEGDNCFLRFNSRPIRTQEKVVVKISKISDNLLVVKDF